MFQPPGGQGAVVSLAVSAGAAGVTQPPQSAVESPGQQLANAAESQQAAVVSAAAGVAGF
jgi:hypothetical protein